MKQISSLITIIFIGITTLNAQNIKIAILDFENTSGIAKYNGLGKAMSSMLITDIEANVSPKRLQLVERSQIQKVLKEQNFQATSAVDKTSSVKAGKLLGVKYLLVGDIYILNDVLVINARLTDTETGDIKFSKKQEGKLVGWLTLKTNIAKELAASIAMPFTEPNIPDKEMNMATITSFGNAITAKDEGKIDKAEELVNTIQEFSPDFKYLDDLKSQLDELKKQVEKNTADIEVLNMSGGRIINAKTPREIVMNIANSLTVYDEASSMIKKLLKFDIEVVKEANYDRFEGLFLPSISPYDNHNTQKVSKDIAFLYSCLNEKGLNPKTCSYYVFAKMRFFVLSFVYPYNNIKGNPLYKNQVNEIVNLAEKLKLYNLTNNLEPYEYKYFNSSVFLGKNGIPQILSPFDSDKYARELKVSDFNIDWVISFLK